MVKIDRKITAKVGKRVIDMLNTNKKISASIKNLEKILADNGYSTIRDGNWGEEMAVEWAYTGCVLAAVNGGDPVKRLQAYVRNIKETLQHNKYSDPAFYIPESYNAAFK
jgi:hypothetical protein